MLIIFTGNGKGKTTAALGQAVRMVGRGKRVLMIQFIKGPWKSGEDFVEIVQKGGVSGFELRKRGLGFVGILGDTLPKSEHVKAATSAFAEFKTELESGKWGSIVLDEVNVAVNLGLLSETDVLRSLEGLPPKSIVILTGRNAPSSFVDRADLVTEMREIKHPFQKGELGEIASEF